MQAGTVKVIVVVWLAAALLGSACTSIEHSATPSAPAIDLTGTWRGDFTVQGLTAEMVWTLTQTGTSVSGPILARLPNGIVLLNGFLTGTLAGSTLTYTISVGPQGIPTQPACVGQLGGTMTAQTGVTSSLNGTYTVTSSTCTPPFASSGNLALTRG
jgi:hypothetical protein